MCKVSEFDYDLLLNPDYNTRCFAQWYFFRIQNTRANRTYRFSIINLVKPSSIYSEGMRPLIYSVKDAEQGGRGWHRAGFDISYFEVGQKG